ncbi:MAG: AAA family ATPase [Leptolyngbyaceae cyanobacterium SL_5_9]|nr:AAA family ATPase [Leptolyngbyaceae cyanobacterium SL_5_9]NJO75372.1 AAA family ATPase [Leptolyngbyaceae cyanobacterium RM1_406_9]
MPNKLTCLKVKNFRSLADVTVDINDLNVLFGSNGSGKSTFLDTVWFIRDCAINGVESASTARSHGIGALWDGADEGANISITLETEKVEYEVLIGYSSGRIEPFVGEKLHSKIRNIDLINRVIGSDKSAFYSLDFQDSGVFPLRDPEKLALSRYIDFEDGAEEASELDRLLHFVHLYHSRDANLYRLKSRGSDSSYQTWLWERGENLWSVLRNLHDKRRVDNRYDTIIDFMREGFPSFDDILLEQTGPTTVYGSFLERKRQKPIQASGVSDGHLQMLIHLTALFSEGSNRNSLILFDEPEISLHPWAISVFAKAAKLAAETWSKQIFIATHSPVLMSQFNSENILETEVDEIGQTVIKRVSEIDEVQDLLEDYPVGSLYMAEAIAPQSKPFSRIKGE